MIRRKPIPKGAGPEEGGQVKRALVSSMRDLMEAIVVSVPGIPAPMKPRPPERVMAWTRAGEEIRRIGAPTMRGEMVPGYCWARVLAPELAGLESIVNN